MKESLYKPSLIAQYTAMHKRATFPSHIDQLHSMLHWITQNLPSALIHPVELASEEVIINIITHARCPSLEVELNLTSTQLQLTFKDMGPPFDPTKHRYKPPTTLDEAQPGGLGILFIRKTMDEVHYQRHQNHNILTLIKKF